MKEGRLISTIVYEDGSGETMDFELLDPEAVGDLRTPNRRLSLAGAAKAGSGRD